MFKKYLIPLLTLLSYTASAQPVNFQKVIRGTDFIEVFAGAPTGDKGMLAVGRTNGSGSLYYDRNYIARIDSLGSVRWTRSYADSGHMLLLGASQTASGEFIATGVTEFGMSAYIAHISKLSASGNVIWHKSVLGNQGQLAIEHNGGYVFTGMTPSPTTFGSTGTYLLKTDTAGTILWSRFYNLGGAAMQFFGITKTADGGMLLAGNFDRATSADILLMKVNGTGAISWLKGYRANQRFEDIAMSCIQLADGSFVVTGYTSADLNSRKPRTFLMKVNATGGLLWSRKYTLSDEDYARSVIACKDGGFAITGSRVRAPQNGRDGFLLRTDDTGGVRWAKIYGEEYAGEELRSGYQTPDGGFMLTGTINIYAGKPGKVAYFVKTDSTGNAGCATSDTTLLAEPLKMDTVTLTWLNSNFTADTDPRTVVSMGVGTVEVICSTVGVPAAAGLTGLSLHPNPAQSQVTVRAPGHSITEFRIAGVSGATVYSAHVASADQLVVDVSRFPAGVYFYTLTTSDKQTARGKLVVTH